RLSKVHRATEWLRPSFARSSATMSASVRDQMPKPSCVSCQLGSPTTTRFTRTRLSDIVHPVSSSQLTQDPNRVRSFGGYNTNRDASLIFDDQEIAEYLAQVFDYDWNRLATGHPTQKRPRVARAGEATPPGFKRVPFSAVFED